MDVNVAKNYPLELHYGPYESNKVIRQKNAKVFGLADQFEELGYDVKLIPSPHLNRMSIKLLGVEVFTANISLLPFLNANNNCECHERAIEAVLDASKRFFNPENKPKFPLIRMKDLCKEEAPSILTIH